MKEQKPNWTTGIALILVVAAFFTINQWNQKQEKALADQKQELKNKNEKLSKEIERLQSTNDYLKEQPSAAEEKNGYHTWPEIEKKADRLVKESDGNFKKSWAMYLVKEAERYKINPFLVYELLKVETGGTFDPELVGPETKYGHAYGMSQFMKNTAPWIADMAGLPYEEELLFDPYYSMQLSLVYLDFLQNKYDNWDEALTAYHRGMGGLNEYKEENGHAESWYAKEIQEKAESHTTVVLAN
ncbi:transglycosylase SLT domain-containing protein [Halobacillus aidingensis]|uniref:Transglycosylase SLT domain-containing protein n=1 Tax=Halobacillus aidingensis TaxID=240303 RepID=A0A1H0TMI4_HALAD|nr:transglycosylase SLT domain-containing protein [Halobacillus aidingensis]SDP55234.1 Transglycosylase SLT domain-containing protein [Halobacillus aidingensis]